MKADELPFYCKPSSGFGIFHTVLAFCGHSLTDIIRGHLLLGVVSADMHAIMTVNYAFNCSPGGDTNNDTNNDANLNVNTGGNNEESSEEESEGNIEIVRLERMQEELADLEKDKINVQNAIKLNKVLPKNILTEGNNSYINTLKERDYDNYLKNPNIEQGLDSLTDTVDNLIEETKEDIDDVTEQLRENNKNKGRDEEATTTGQDKDANRPEPFNPLISEGSSHSTGLMGPPPKPNKPLSSPTEFVADQAMGEMPPFDDPD